MKEETISYELLLTYPPGSLNPIDINEHYLESVEIIDADNQINRSMLRIGSIGTNIVFANESKDEIRILPTSIRIESKNVERISYIVNALKERFGDISIQICNIFHDVHLIDESFPSSIFQNYSSTKGLELDVMQFKSGNKHIVMYSCGKQKLHFRIGSESKFGKRLLELDIINELEIDNLETLFQEFKTNELKL